MVDPLAQAHQLAARARARAQALRVAAQAHRLKHKRDLFHASIGAALAYEKMALAADELIARLALLDTVNETDPAR